MSLKTRVIPCLDVKDRSQPCSGEGAQQEMATVR